MEYDQDTIKLVVARLSAKPANISFSIGNYGDFTPRELIEQVKSQTEVGKATIEMQIAAIRLMPKIAASLSREAVV